jgi:putative toxin-antitoxin system antitoxin component (TIGR02293 family)
MPRRTQKPLRAGMPASVVRRPAFVDTASTDALDGRLEATLSKWHNPIAQNAVDVTPDDAQLMELADKGVSVALARDVICWVAASAADRLLLVHRLAPSLADTTKGTRLSSIETDRILRLARVFAITRAAARDLMLARRLFASPIEGLGGRRPLDLVDSDPGMDMVLRAVAACILTTQPSLGPTALSPRR